MQTTLYFNNKRFTEKEFSKEKELEDLMFQNSKSTIKLDVQLEDEPIKKYNHD